MNESPSTAQTEDVLNTATPEEVLLWLAGLRQRHALGLMTTEEFETALGKFEFSDEMGGIWTPGVASGRWYRWDGMRWAAATPAARLRVPPLPKEIEVIRLLAERQEGDEVSSCLLCGGRLRPRDRYCRACGLPIAQQEES